MYTTSVTTLLALSATVYGVAFDGPLPTPINDLLHADINGWTPKPTNLPRAVPNIFRRQSDDEGLCGYIEGDGTAPVSCTVGDCYYNTAIEWFGCCTGTKIDSCNIATRCVASSEVNSCVSDSACSNDQYLTACTEASRPACAEMYSVASGVTVSHLVCAATEVTVEVLNESTELDGASSASGLFGSAEASSVSARVTSASATRTASARASSSTASDDDDDAESSVAVAATKSTTGGQSAAPSTVRPAAVTSSSTAGAAMQTAAAFVGAAGGLAGVIAMLF